MDRRVSCVEKRIKGEFVLIQPVFVLSDDDDLLLFLQKQNLASAIYLFGLGTRLYPMFSVPLFPLPHAVLQE
jgi:hypothetical protein